MGIHGETILLRWSASPSECVEYCNWNGGPISLLNVSSFEMYEILEWRDELLNLATNWFHAQPNEKLQKSLLNDSSTSFQI